MRILLLSAYDALSHRRWREGLVAGLGEHDWTVLTLPPRNFSWRIRGNGFTWATTRRDVLERPYDLILATSMTDLAGLRGLVPALGRVPAVVYFHENQFAYPLAEEAPRDVTPGWMNLCTALAADTLAFNSAYNRDSFLDGARELLERMPDGVRLDIVDELAARSAVLPVPLADDCLESAPVPRASRFTIIWNHRWEYDKAPERFFAALYQLEQRGVDFQVHVIGQDFQRRPAVFDEARQRLEHRIGAWGYVEDIAAYRALLRQGHVVVSTALHDFQGLAIAEAVAAGCVPAVPDRLAYREMFSKEYHFPGCINDGQRDAEALADRLANLARSYVDGALPTPPDVSHLSWIRLIPSYRYLLENREFTTVYSSSCFLM